MFHCGLLEILKTLDSDGGFEGDHQLLCNIKHHGDVMDLQVRLL